MSSEGKKKITLMVIPHAEQSMKTISFSISIVKLITSLCVFILLCSAVGVWRFYEMKNELVIMPELIETNKENQQQIEYTTKELEEIKEMIRQVEELEQQVRSSLGMKQPETVDKTPVNVEPPSLLGGIGGGPLVESSRIGIASRGVGTRSTNVTEGMVQSLEFTQEIVDPADTLEDLDLDLALPTEQEIELIKQELTLRINGLEEVKVTVDRKKAVERATPSIQPASGRITSPFGYRTDPFTRRRVHHDGIDIAGPTGTPIRSTADGTVIFSGVRSGYGNVVIVNHGYGYSTLYAHNSRNVAKVGDRVQKGQLIAYVGSTGRSTGPHVHYEVRVNGKVVNPRNYF